MSGKRKIDPRVRVQSRKNVTIRGHQFSKRYVELEQKNELTLDEVREFAREKYEAPMVGETTGRRLDGDLPYRELIPIWKIRKDVKAAKGRLRRLEDRVWCFYTAMAVELPQWRLVELVERQKEYLTEDEAMRVYNTALALMEDCGV